MIDTTPIDSFRYAVETEEDKYKNEVLNDYWICCVSREASVIGRREVLTGKAKFGILGDGKEVPQVAMARSFKKGDFRSGYYRDQTLMFALGLATVEDYFAQLYADAENDPWSGGRQMNSHFASPLIDEKGKWLDHTKRYNISSDISATGAQMARALGLAFASMKFRDHETFENSAQFSDNGNEVCFATIGDASTSEGVFWETINAAGVVRVPLAISVWDDGYGISVPKAYQTTKESVSHALQGFQDEGKGSGIDIYTEKGYDYPALCILYEKAINKVRTEHIPALLHITDLTQPQGHSTSGSHERYKSKERMEFEKEMDCILHMGQWMIEVGISDREMLDEIKKRAVVFVREGKNRAWKAFRSPIRQEIQRLIAIYERMNAGGGMSEDVIELQAEIGKLLNPVISELVDNARRVLYTLSLTNDDPCTELREWLVEQEEVAHKRYHTHLYAEDYGSALDVNLVEKEFASVAKEMNGFQVINKFFDQKFTDDPRLFAFGEDVGMIGGVNQGFSGLQQKYGRKRIFDTGIREWTIVGQAIGLAMRGWKPIAEIQYLDYIIYGLQPLMDDLATLRYRSAGQQTAPAIIRTRGHRLEGIFHAGSHIGLLINGLRGMYLICPRDMVQAAGFYNTLLKSEEPGLVIECLNGYRLKERVPDNLGEYTLPLGVPEILDSGDDVTLVTYGSCVRVARAALELLENHGISVELIDVQTLLPFDLKGIIVDSIQKTNKVVFLDEDVPGGATGYMMQKVLDEGGAYSFLDAPPRVISAKPHRTPYGSDGDYFTKPQTSDVFKVIYKMMHEYDPDSYPAKF